VVSGLADGPDTLGIDYAKANGIPWVEFPAKWRINGVYHPEAGFVRNGEMANYAEALIAVWDGKSRGTKHMITVAKLRNLKIFVYKTE
jgi:hypothetical protein